MFFICLDLSRDTREPYSIENRVFDLRSLHHYNHIRIRGMRCSSLRHNHTHLLHSSYIDPSPVAESLRRSRNTGSIVHRILLSTRVLRFHIPGMDDNSSAMLAES